MEEEKKPNQEHDDFFELPEEAQAGGGDSLDLAQFTKRSKMIERICAVILAIVAAATCFFVGWLSHYFSLDKGVRDFLWAKDQTNRHYYEEIDNDKLYDDIMSALESQLDPYSYFYSNEEYARILRESEGQNEGLGIYLIQTAEGLRVYDVIENSPAQAAGMRRGMFILAYGKGSILEPMGAYSKFQTFLSEQSGEFSLRCGYEADGADAKVLRVAKREYLAAYTYYRDSELTCVFRGEEKIALTSIEQEWTALPQDTAYVRLMEFNGNAGQEFRICLEKMKERGKKHLILDLRGNGGGYMSVLCEIASYLLRNATGGQPTVTNVKYKDGSIASYRANANEYFDFFTEESKITVLADDGTASASECLIGAMYDYGTIAFEDIYLSKTAQEAVGCTYGKGIMQSHFTSASGDVMKLTVATVHWPTSDRCIHGVGVTEENGAHAIVAPVIEKGDSFLDQLLA